MQNYLIERLFYDKTGQIIVSAIFGLSFALLFYMPVKIVNTVFKYNNKCYKLNKINVKCSNNNIAF